MNTNHLYMIAFALAVSVIVYEDISKCHRLPWPPRIIMTGLVFALLDIFAMVQPELAAVIAIGVVLAFIVNKGFGVDVERCGPFTAAATAQPTDADTFLQSPTPGDQSTSTGGNLDLNNLPQPGPGQTLT